MAKMNMKQFEKSGLDKEPKGVKEGSAADKRLDKKQLAAANAGKGVPGFRRGGKHRGR